jgi:hemoglobin
MITKKDIENEGDIKLLVNSFYNKATANNLLGPIFNDVAKVNWEQHLPIMYLFWESILLGKKNFQGNVMEKHMTLHKQSPLQMEHFDTWKAIWIETVNELFDGKKADEAKNRALSIADLMLYKIRCI